MPTILVDIFREKGSGIENGYILALQVGCRILGYVLGDDALIS